MTTRDLGRLGAELDAAGWPSSLRYDNVPALLRVMIPGLPTLGESISVRTGPDGAPWFWSSTGAPLAQCSDLVAANRCAPCTRHRSLYSDNQGHYFTGSAPLSEGRRWAEGAAVGGP